MVVLFYTLTVLLLVYGLVVTRKEKKKHIEKRLSTVFHQIDPNLETETAIDSVEKLSFSKRMMDPIWNMMKKKLQRKLSSEKKEKLENKLLQAGNPMGMTQVEFQIVKLALIIIFPFLFGLYGYILNQSAGIIFILLFLGILLAVYIPAFYLKQKTATRNKQALRELPDFLDLVTVSIEAGLGFDSALSKVVAKKNGVLATEFQRCLEEMRLGKTRREALSGVRDRLILDDIKSLIGSILQAEQLGIGMVQILRVQSNEVRQRRKQRAEEAAMKAPIKMLFPLVFFIFPCIFVVLLGPAVIRMMQTF
ncbi:type II secretion system F family protein [Aquibacillus sp. 3ASR75-11]|uniref:Type II secretion system F family protein n=1 Tax=Terrihalobacillus insolitus TaxID=2950438 RepID=A0A9X4AMJ0_9BACI|nr:type II secretion system F family protein [Terrihalobacillus insolitus]MDC3413642.1 type II secretion system F family protein [Terrihalobacillus insolitus]MDC3425482.1 type II secretion system F family protein [Terrihalobacillus insolitus]